MTGDVMDKKRYRYQNVTKLVLRRGNFVPLGYLFGDECSRCQVDNGKVDLNTFS